MFGKPKAGLATKPGKAKVKIVRTRAQVGPAGGARKAVISRRVFVTGVSGPLQNGTIGSPPQPNPYERAKTARIACPQSAPHMLSAIAEGTAGSWHPDWNVVSGGYEEDGVSKAYITVIAHLHKAADGSPVPEFPGNLSGYEFELRGECVS
jgi:hypothetical protein